MPQCEPFNTYLMSHVTLVASKNVKFRLSQNLTKFDAVTRLHENIPTVKSVSSFEIYKNSRLLAEITILPYFRKLKFSRVLHGQSSEVNLLGNSPKKFIGPSDVNCWTIFPTQFFGQLSDKIIIFNNFTKEFIVLTTLRFYLSCTHTYYSRVPRCI